MGSGDSPRSGRIRNRLGRIMERRRLRRQRKLDSSARPQQEELRQLTVENRALKTRVKALGDPGALEREARRLGMVPAARLTRASAGSEPWSLGCHLFPREGRNDVAVGPNTDRSAGDAVERCVAVVQGPETR